MKYVLCIMMMLGAGCGTKRKMLSQTKEIVREHLINKNESKHVIKNTNWKLQTDTTINIQWLKIYTKGEVQFSNGNFKGHVDSLLWYVNKSDFNKEALINQNSILFHNQQGSEALISKKTELKLKDKQKSANVSLSWLLFLLAIIIVVWFVWRKVWIGS